MSAAPAMSGDDILNAVGELPSLPKAVTRLMRSIEDENTSFNVLAQQIEADTGLLASVLRLVNSPRYMARGGISTASQAVVVLGFNTIRNLVCVAGMTHYFRKNGAGVFDHEHFLRHSTGVACVAKLLAKRLGLDPETAFDAGMLHDLGQLALAATAPNEFGRVMDYQKENDCTVSEAERAVLGIDHAKIGAHLANLWSLPAEICSAIEYHHQIADSCALYPPIADLIHVAEVVAHAMELGSTDPVQPLSDSAMLRLRLSLRDVEPLLGEFEKEYSDYSQMLET